MLRRSRPWAATASEKLMSIEIRVPALPESIADATLVAWHKQPGEAFKRDENLADLETDKAVLEVTAPADGVMGEHKFDGGATVTEGQGLAQIEAGAAPAGGPVALRVLGQESPRSFPHCPRRPGAGHCEARSGADRSARGPRRTACGHEPAASAGRAAVGRGAVHPGAAHLIQRGRSGHGSGAARPLQGQVRESPGRETRVHVLLREGDDRGAEEVPGGQRLRGWDRYHLSRVLRHWCRRIDRSRPDGADRA